MSVLPVIIPAYKRPDQLEKCKSALKAQTGVTPLLFVHDNSENNIGFTKAVNRGLRWAIDESYPYALALNQDCYLRPNALFNLIAFMDAHPRCAVAGVKQLHSGDEDVIIHGGCTMAYPYGKHIVGRVSNGDCAEPRWMPWVNGACFAFRMEALRETGLLDEGMWFIGSDSDICYTARLRGWEVMYTPDVVCVHECGESMNPTSPELIKIMRKDMEYFSRKWIGSQAFAWLSRSPAFAPSLAAVES